MYWKSNPKLYPPHLRSRIRRGRGIGQGLSYDSWLKIRDVPSKGTSSDVHGILVDRPYHLLSEFETTYFFLAERIPSSVDIREQWPILDLDRTLELCAKFGVRHIYRGIYPEPFTIDFLVTTSINGKLQYSAKSVKTPEDAADPDIRLRLMIEYVWCREHGIRWALIDTSKFSKEMLSNLRFMRAWFTNRYQPDLESALVFAQTFLASYRTNIPLNELIYRTAKPLRLSDDVAEDTFRYCAWSDRIAVSLEHHLALNMPLVLRRTNDIP